MTAAIVAPTTPSPRADLPDIDHPGSGQPSIDWRGIVRAEWTKIRSVRSSVWALLLLVVLSVGFTALFIGLTVSQWDKTDATQRLAIMADPTRVILGAGFQLSQLAVCVLGVLVMSSEYSSGTIRASLLAVPRRTPMLAAKAVVFASLVFVAPMLHF